METPEKKTTAVTHDQGVERLFSTKQGISREKVVRLFLASLSTRRMDWRCGLSAFAMAEHFPEHSFTYSSTVYCPECGDHGLFNDENLGYLAQNFLDAAGTVIQISAGGALLAYCLDKVHAMPEVIPAREDQSILKEIIKLIRASQGKDSVNDLEKRIGSAKVIKSNKDERRGIIETFALCGILETPEHKGYYKNFNNSDTREQRERGAQKNDWGYPSRWWKGNDGVNEEALQYWFGEYINS